MTLVEIHTKAAARRRSGEWAASLTAGDSYKGVEGADSLTTRHRMGLVAAIAGLSTLKRRCAVELHTDSEYLISGAITWFPLHMSLGWLGDGKHRIRNHVLWDQLRVVAARHDIQWHGPRHNTDAFDEFTGIMDEHGTEVWGRTVGDGPDVGHVYSGHVLPWDDSLGEYRAFNDGDAEVCSNIGTDDTAEPPLPAKQRQARKRLIARVAERFRPEYIRGRNGDTLIQVHPDTLSPPTHSNAISLHPASQSLQG